MPLPTSTIVFAIATCVPFALAVRDTVTGKHTAELEELYEELEHREDDEEHEDAEEDAEAEDEEYDEEIDELRREAIRRRREEERLAAERSQALRDKVRLLVGIETASLGDVFEGTQLGGSAAQAEDEALRRRLDIYRDEASLDIAFLHDTETLHGVFVKPLSGYGRQDVCEVLDGHLRDSWGLGRERGARRVWVNEASFQRAVFDERRGCELHFEKFSPLGEWLSRAETSVVPMWAVGKRVDALVAKLGDRAASTGEQVMWSGLGIGAATGTTQLTADLRRGKVVSVLASVETDAGTQARLIDHISELTGKQPVEADDGDRLTWKVSPPIELQISSSQLFVTIGKRPED